MQNPTNRTPEPQVHSWWIPGGDFGTLATLATMRSLVNRGIAEPAVRDFAIALIGRIPSRDYPSIVVTIRAFLNSRFKFVPDPRGVELLQTPQLMLHLITKAGRVAGDCDDAAILGAALGKAVGLLARFRVLGFYGTVAPYRHVITDLFDGSRWVDLDVTKPSQQLPPTATRVMLKEV